MTCDAQRCSLAALLLAAALAAASLPRTGWLQRVVDFQKLRFFNEVSELAPVSVQAQIQPKPAGFEDSSRWDYDAVVRLLALIRGSEAGRAVRRMLRPTRRHKMSMRESMRWFPSIRKPTDDIYYDVDYTSSEEGGPYGPADADRHVVVITNPVESRMPAASISIACLKRVLEHRAHVLRQMPPKLKPWQLTPARKKRTKRRGKKKSTTVAGEGDASPTNSTNSTDGADGAANDTSPGDDNLTSSTPDSEAIGPVPGT